MKPLCDCEVVTKISQNIKQKYNLVGLTNTRILKEHTIDYDYNYKNSEGYSKLYIINIKIIKKLNNTHKKCF